jgi:sulfatase modifying factor 1
MRSISALLPLLVTLASAAPPVVSNIRVSQRPGTKLVDIHYDLADADGDAQLIQLAASANAGLTYTIPCVTLSGSVGANVAPGANRHIIWNAGADWNGNWVPQCRLRITAHDGTTPPSPPGMVHIPAGPFQMGDTFAEGDTGERPVHNVQLSAYFIDKTEITGALWDLVKEWGNDRDYGIGGGSWSTGNHPVTGVTWHHVVMWCNARSEMEGLVPCYYTSAEQTTVLKNGLDILNEMVRWDANGYRLPTEAEWEKAARGGATGLRYPWGDEITLANANYSDAVFANPVPVASYPANAYGLFDMAGNVSEWCWDWYSPSYYGLEESGTNPRGTANGGSRLLRGGSATSNYGYLRVANRTSQSPGHPGGYPGFRTVRKSP